MDGVDPFDGHVWTLASGGDGILEVNAVRFDPATCRVWVDLEERPRLPPKQARMLGYLMANAGRVVSREELMLRVWRHRTWTSTKTVDVHVQWLRRSLGDTAEPRRFLTTVWGRGYRFELGTAPTTATAP
ncbi:winged helix-turn-helix domain-containing protein [Nocardioides panacisoli]|uniref:OmpR/PhoB-type domain-containing protein n=1 Tax=Nocardioides panacisoli TaxID=627624 RepID=A0ABP7I8M1_9ACTN